MIREISPSRALKPTGERSGSVLEWPAYRTLLDNGKLERRVTDAYARLEHGDLCARYCRVSRRQTLDDVIPRTGEGGGDAWLKYGDSRRRRLEEYGLRRWTGPGGGQDRRIPGDFGKCRSPWSAGFPFFH